MMLTITNSYSKGNTYVYRDETKRYQSTKREALAQKRKKVSGLGQSYSLRENGTRSCPQKK